MIVICPMNPTPVFGFNKQFAYKKFVQYERMNFVKTLQNLQSNKNEFWYTSGEIIISCLFLLGEMHICDYGNDITGVDPMFPNNLQEIPKFTMRQISVTLKGICNIIKFHILARARPPLNI